MHEIIRRAIADLSALIDGADSEDADHIRELIERLQSMDDTIRQAIADLSALIDSADSEDAERIRELIERLQNFDAHVQ